MALNVVSADNPNTTTGKTDLEVPQMIYNFAYIGWAAARLRAYKHEETNPGKSTRFQQTGGFRGRLIYKDAKDIQEIIKDMVVEQSQIISTDENPRSKHGPTRGTADSLGSMRVSDDDPGAPSGKL